MCDQTNTTTTTANAQSAAVSPALAASVAATEAPALDVDSNTVTLGYALMRGEQEIKTISFRKPVTGDLCGLTVTQLLNTDVDQMSAFLPRITTPSIMASEIEKLPVSDFLNLSMKALGFFTESPSQTA